MEVDEVRQKAELLKKSITDLTKRFISETGCRPEITLQYDKIQSMGLRNIYIPYVDIEVKVV